jgi:pentatricopeptide repeat protein
VSSIEQIFLDFKIIIISNNCFPSISDLLCLFVLFCSFGACCVETEDGYVEIVGFTSKASKLVRYAVKVGDRVLAVDSSLGDRMWPVSTVEGVISSVTARLPGQQITFRFERSSNTDIINNNINNENDATTTAVTASTISAMVDATVQSEAGVLVAARSNSTLLNIEDTATISTVGMDEELLQRCQEIMKRYKNDEKYVNKFELPRVVADKVVGARASAETQVDSVTLSMILTAYLSCKQPKMAIRVFEAAVGLRADGTNGKVETTDMSTTASDDPLMGKEGKQIVQNIEALDIFTISALLKAHAMNGDLLAVQTVLSALVGRGGTEMNGVEVALWPETGPYGSLQPDNHCYNIAISAAGNSDTDNGLELALQFFDTLSNPVNNNNKYENRNIRRIEKDVVSYNSVLKALANYGKFEEAIETFYQMKKAGIKPDKYTYTALAKSVIVVDDKDVEELLYDMKEEGVKSDVKTFNTIIRYLCEQKKLNAAKKVVSWMEKSGLHPDSWTYSFLMNGLLQSGNPSGALALFETACSDKRTAGLTENVYLYTTAMTSAAAIGDHTRALELLSRMNALGIKPNIKTMTALLSACLSAEEPELAVEIFRRIPNPDPYAVTKGLLALSQAGKGNEALIMLSEKDTVAGSIQGKQLNNIYESLFQKSIKENDYMQARQVLKSLLGKGNIPSKVIFQNIFDSMGLTLSKGLSQSSVGLVNPKSLNEEDAEKFEFLLFLVDSLSGRNLPCEAPLYATILSFGHHLGGLPKKISALMVSAKAHSGLYAEKNMKFIDEERCETTSCLIGGWEDLFQSFDELRIQIDGPSSLPELQVRISSRELSRVLTAEKNLSYRKRMFV